MDISSGKHSSKLKIARSQTHIIKRNASCDSQANKLNTLNSSIEEMIGPGRYEIPTLWVKKSVVCRNNPSFSFSKSFLVERADKCLPGVGKYNADGLKLKKRSPRVIMSKTQRFIKLAPTGDIAAGEYHIHPKIHGVYLL